MELSIREVSADEWPLWRDLRLRALGDVPDAFRSTLEEESSQPDSWWSDRVSDPNGAFWVAETEAGAVGILASELDDESGVVNIHGLWVAPDARGHRLGDELLGACLVWARERKARAAQLWVNQGNAMARTLYARAGFSPTSETEQLRPGSSRIVIKKTRLL